MRLRNRVAAWLGHPVNLVLGLVMFGTDIAAVVGWVQDNDLRFMRIDPGAPVYAGVLFVCTSLGVVFLWAWVATHPRRRRNRFSALYDEIVACRDLLVPSMSEDDAVVEAVGRVADLHHKLGVLGVSLSVRDLYDGAERAKCWARLTVLVGYAAEGDIRGARGRTEAT